MKCFVVVNKGGENKIVVRGKRTLILKTNFLKIILIVFSYKRIKEQLLLLVSLT